jgi:hypothetical protein
MPLVQTRGAASAQGFGEFAQATVANYIEDVFSCFLFTGTGANQTITNGIDLSTKGGLVWTKCRSNAQNNSLVDTVRGGDVTLVSDTTAANDYGSGQGAQSFTSTGFVTGGFSARTYVSWTFREQPKFFDVVTYTGTGSNRTIAHSLGSVPGSIIVKRTDTTAAWAVYHRSLANTQYLVLNTTAAAATDATRWNSTTPTSTVFSVGTDATVNASGGTYVAYLFAHDAGGFGLTGTDNVISCGSYTGSSTVDVPVNLGYEPQWVMIKNVTTSATDWYIADIMRGMALTGIQPLLAPNLSAEETAFSGTYFTPTATGMVVQQGSGTAICSAGNTYIYIAIRRGPMKVPTLGTSVFGLSARSGTGANATVTGGQTDDAVLIKNRGSAVASLFSSRLTGTGYLVTSSTAAEVAAGTTILQASPWDVMDGVKVGTTSTITNASANTYINWFFRRAPGFFDEVCYTGNGSVQNVTHNLTVVPELMIVKNRTTATYNWFVYSAALGNDSRLLLNTTAAASGGSFVWDYTSPTSSVFTVGASSNVNGSAEAYVAYLFATCAGVSKVGSYTGTGTTQTINCGFTGGARFVLIKRTDDTGDWYVWDSARGIVAGNDPYLLLNSTAAEVTSTDYIDTASTGFEISSTAPAAINANGGSFIFLAIA